MANKTYIGVYNSETGTNEPKQVKKMYISVEGKARKVKKAYISVDGKAKLVYSA